MLNFAQKCLLVVAGKLPGFQEARASRWAIRWSERCTWGETNRWRISLSSQVLALALIAVALLGGLEADSTEEIEHVVRVEIAIDDQVYPHPDGLTIRGSRGQEVSLRLEVTGTRSGLPVDFPEPTDLVEIRPASGGSLPFRFADLEHPSLGVYETSYPADALGEFLIVALPGVSDRASLPSGTFDQAALIVGVGEPGSPVDSAGVVAVVFLLALVGWLVVSTTRGRDRVPKQPVMHDTWWNGP